MEKVRELEIELNCVQWKKKECLYNSEIEKAAEFREKENVLFGELEQLMGSEYIKNTHQMIRYKRGYFEYPLDAQSDEEALKIISAQLRASRKEIEKIYSRREAAARAAVKAAEKAAAFAALPIKSECNEIIWEDLFHHFPIPLINEELTNAQVKEWSYQILKKIKEEFPTVPIESTPDPEDKKVLSGLAKKYLTSTKLRWLEIEILNKITGKFEISNDSEIFFLLYRLLEK